MNARQVVKIIEVEEREKLPVPANPAAEPSAPEYKVVSCRRFRVKKYPALDGLKIAKVFVAKILPVFQSFIPLVSEAQKGRANAEYILSNLGQFLTLDGIAETMDKITPEDLDYIMQKSLQNVSEMLPAGDAPVMSPDGTYGVMDVEYDAVLVLRLVCEAVMWGVGDFFDGNRLASVLSPLTSSLSRNRKM